MTIKVPIESLYLMALSNTMQAFKMAAILNINANLDVLGPAGISATQEYERQLPALFAGAMALWVVVPITLAYMRFARHTEF
jgi:Cu-processing system permease protein